MNLSLLLFLTALALPFIVRLVVRWVVGPLTVKFKRRVQYSRHWLDGLPTNLAPAAREQLQQHSARLLAAGFEERSRLHALPDANQVASTVVILVHPQTSEIAQLIQVQTAVGNTVVMSIMSEFVDGTALTTSTNPSATFLPKNPARQSINARWIRDAAALLSFHRARLSLHQHRDHPPVTLQPGQEREYLEADSARSVAHMRACGFIEDDRSRKFGRYTWRGAFLAALRMTEPSRGRRARAAEAEARQEWNRAAVEQVAMPVAEPQIEAAPDTGGVQYGAVADRARFTFTRTGDGLTITMGGTTVLRELRERWLTFLWTVLIILMLLPLLNSAWTLYRLVGDWSIVWKLMSRRSSSLAWLAVFFAITIAGLFLGYFRRRGPFQVRIDSRELHYYDSARYPHAGTIDRREISGVLVRAVGFRSFRREFALCIIRHVGRPILLMRNINRAALEDTQRQVASELGLL